METVTTKDEKIKYETVAVSIELTFPVSGMLANRNNIRRTFLAYCSLPPRVFTLVPDGVRFDFT